MADLDVTSVGDINPNKLRDKRWPSKAVLEAGPTGIPSKAELDDIIGASERRSRESQHAKQLRELRESAVRDEERRTREDKLFGNYPNPYYAGPQVGIFIGTQWLMDAITIEYNETVSKTPLFGYASTHFDAVAKGNTLVQGQLSIAYTAPDYLTQILSQYASQEGQQSMFPTRINDPIERAKKLFWRNTPVNTSVSKVPLEYGYEGGTTGRVRRGFDIRVFFGAQEFIRDHTINLGGGVRPTGPIEVIQDVHLTGRNVLCAPSGEPIVEAYTFFAKAVTTRVPRQSLAFNAVTARRDGSVNVADVGGRTVANAKHQLSL